MTRHWRPIAGGLGERGVRRGWLTALPMATRDERGQACDCAELGMGYANSLAWPYGGWRRCACGMRCRRLESVSCSRKFQRHSSFGCVLRIEPTRIAFDRIHGAIRRTETGGVS